MLALSYKSMAANRFKTTFKLKGFRQQNLIAYRKSRHFLGLEGFHKEKRLRNTGLNLFSSELSS